MPSRSDGELVVCTRGGDAAAYGVLVTRYQGHVYGLAYSFAGRWEDAQDIAQETFIRAYCNLGQLRDPERFAAWLRRVTFSVAVKWMRTFRPGLFRQLDGPVDLESLEIPDFAPGPPEVLEKQELAEAVRQAIASLPPKYRVPLTMFHLDGLSYQKVADFLDIPLGTVQSLIYRARQRLKAALGAYYAEELAPAVQEVFSEHRLPAEFAQSVLADLPRLGWDRGESTFCGAVVACLEFLGDPVPYDLVMGASGHAFRLSWRTGWSTNAGLLAGVDAESAHRTFAALGYQYELVPRHGRPTEEAVCTRLRQSIGAGRPAIIEGGLGPGCCLVAGYDPRADVLLGRTFFDESNDYAMAGDWRNRWQHLLLIGERCEPSPGPELLQEALGQALAQAQTREENGLARGLAAYEAWAADLLDDASFPADDIEVLTWRCHVSHSLVLAAVWDARRAAAAFLRRMGEVAGSASDSTLAAAQAYEEEYLLLDEAMKTAPFCHEPEARRRQMADRALREHLAKLIKQAKQREQEAVAFLEQARQTMQTAGPVGSVRR
jgi:RNA polymerase sigma-70 factor (ECF subfamily)